MLPRWAAPGSVARMSAMMAAPIAPASDEDFVWPDAAEIHRVQQLYLTTSTLEDVEGGEPPGTPHTSTASAAGLHTDAEGRVWIPDEASDLQLRICIVSHTGIGGHRGFRTTLRTIRQFFFWATMNGDIKTFCNTCLHCQSTISKGRTPRPFGQALHAEKPNEVLQMVHGPLHSWIQIFFTAEG
jgi:hypothetical protein